MEFIAIVLVFVGIALGAALYFLPTIIAFNRGHASKWGIFVVNFLFGATFIMWIIALIWALGNKGQKQVVIVNNNMATGSQNV